MRNWIDLIEGVWDSVAPRHDSKPAYMVPMEDGEDDQEYPVWVNPSRNTFTKVVEHCHGEARAPEWLPLLEKAFSRYYRDGVKFEEYNWF